MLSIVLFFIIFTITFAIRNYQKLYFPLRRITEELDQLLIILRKEDIPLNSIENLPKVNEIIENNSKLISDVWKSYYRTIVSRPKIKNVLHPEHYISTDNFLERYTNIKLAQSIPSILTGIGIFGTFFGLVIGLWKLNGLGISVLKDQIPVLIGGMKISFLSSLVAILCSLIWSFLEKKDIYKLDRNINSLVEELALLLPIRNESNLLDEIVENQKKQLNATKEFISDTLIPELVNGLQAAVEKTIAPEINKMNTTVDKLAEVSTNKQAESIDKMVDKFMHTFNESFDNQFDALKDTLEDVIVWQKNTKAEMEDLINTIERNAESQNNLLVSTESLLGNMQNYVSEFDKLHQELNINVNSLNNITGQLNDIEGQVNQKLSAMIKEYTKLDDIRNKEIIRLENQTNEINSYWQSIKDSFNNLNNNLTNSMSQFTDNMYNGLSRTFEVFDENLSDISKRLGITIQNINESVDELPDSINNLIMTIGEFENNQALLLQQINQANDKLDDIKDKDNKGLFSRLGGNR